MRSAYVRIRYISYSIIILFTRKRQDETNDVQIDIEKREKEEKKNKINKKQERLRRAGECIPDIYISTPHVELFNFDPPNKGGGGTWYYSPPLRLENNHLKSNTGDGREPPPPFYIKPTAGRGR